jgi:hypothetical protein
MMSNAGGVPDICRTLCVFKSLFFMGLPDVPDMPEVFRARTHVFY